MDLRPSAASSAADALLRDGRTIHLRPVQPSDAEAIVALHNRLSNTSVTLRYFNLHRELSADEVQRIVHATGGAHLVLVAELGPDLVGWAEYIEETDRTAAEAAFVVDDAHQGLGIGALLLEHLAAAARRQGIEQFVATVLRENHKMLAVFHDAGFVERRAVENGIVELSFPIRLTEGALDAADRREHVAEVASMTRLLRPRSIAVIGAGRNPASVGHAIVRNLLAGDFQGRVHPVNPGAAHIHGVQTHPSAAAIPGGVDLGVVAVPAPSVAAAVDDCAAAGATSVLIVSAGFSELGAPDAERDLVHRARLHGMRLVGPNCLGMANTDPNVSMNATFSPFPARPGRVAMLTQSGAIGIAALARAVDVGLGLSSFVSAGNKADVSGNDLLQYWEEDEQTDVILLYLESFGNPRKFARIARRVSRSKPIVALKSGRTPAGIAAARSHTASAASPDVAVDALFRQTGVIRVDTVEDLFDVAVVAADQPIPPGRRVAIVGNSGGPGILAVDAMVGVGLRPAELGPETRHALAAAVPQAASTVNPVDLLATATADDYRTAVRVVLDDPDVDAVVAVFTPPLVTTAADVGHALVGVATEADKPIVAAILGAGDQDRRLLIPGTDRSVPCFTFPERAVRALGRVAAYAAWRRDPTGTVPVLDGVDEPAARRLVDTVLRTEPDGCWLAPATAAALLRSYGVPLLDVVPVRSADEAVAAASSYGAPVALKAADPTVVHKTDVGGVRLGLRTPEEITTAWADLQARFGEVALQPMAAPGVETIVGLVQDPLFGPLIMFGMGGVATDLLGDRAFRILPLTDLDAEGMIAGLRSAPLLTGYRGSEPVDLAAIEDVLQRVSRLALDLPEVVELDLNPLVASPSNAVAIDVKVRLAPVPDRPDPLIRALR